MEDVSSSPAPKPTRSGPALPRESDSFKLTKEEKAAEKKKNKAIHEAKLSSFRQRLLEEAKKVAEELGMYVYLS